MKRTINLILIISFALLIIMTLTGCVTNPITGKSLNTGSLRVINESSGSIYNIELFSGSEGTGDKIWSSGSSNISSGSERTFTDVPAGTWSVKIQNQYVNNVRIVFGMTTIVNRSPSGNLTAGIPVPF